MQMENIWLGKTLMRHYNNLLAQHIVDLFARRDSLFF